MRSQGLADSDRGPDEAVASESESESRKLDAAIRVSRTKTRMSSLGLGYCDLTYSVPSVRMLDQLYAATL